MIIMSSIVADKPTATGNIYPRSVLNDAIEKFNKANKRNQRVGGVLNRMHIQQVKDPTHTVEEMFMNDTGVLCAKISFLESEHAQKVKDDIESGRCIVARPVISVPAPLTEGNCVIDEIVDIVRVQIEYEKD